jgi:hypothetical protein
VLPLYAADIDDDTVRMLAHARWEEIQFSDVKPGIDFTRELMAALLG